MNYNMRKLSLWIFCLVALLLQSHSQGLECPPGQVLLHRACLDCLALPNTQPGSPHAPGECFCSRGYAWSSTKKDCVPRGEEALSSSGTKRSGQLRRDGEELREMAGEAEGRRLASGCDPAKGFIWKNNACVSCRDIPFSIGLARDELSCYCQNRYYWFDYYQLCQCYYDTGYIYYNGGSCNGSCNLIANQTQQDQCNACTGPTFGYNRFGCFNCSSIPNGVAGNGLGACVCQPGFLFVSALGKCVCSASGYALTGTVCLACASLPAAQSNACSNCLAPTYIRNGFLCQLATAIRNIVPASGTCPQNFVLSKNPVTLEIVSCVCSAAQGFFTNGALCVSCSSASVSGVSVADCQACSSAKGFFRAADECIYCPSAPFSSGTASVNGCGCRQGYYWNVVNSRCDCDWSLGFVGQPGSCINCANVANTEINGTAAGCICVKGYKWSVNQCVCDVASGSFLTPSQACVNCRALLGARGFVLNNNSCACLPGLSWDSARQLCVCDYRQNFVTIRGLCRDCSTVPFSNGFATASGCECFKGYVWQGSSQSCVGCAAGFVSINGVCQSCASAPLPVGATVAGCQSCSNAQGFVLAAGVCLACTSSLMSTGATKGNACVCKDVSLIWYPELQTCACYFFIGYLSIFENGQQTCKSCSLTSIGCTCEGTNKSYQNGVCTICTGVPNSNGSSTAEGTCACYKGYAFGSTYPYSCVCSS